MLSINGDSNSIGVLFAIRAHLLEPSIVPLLRQLLRGMQQLISAHTVSASTQHTAVGIHRPPSHLYAVGENSGYGTNDWHS